MKYRDDGSMPRNYFKSLIVHASIKHDVLAASLKTKTIKSRFKHKSLYPEHPGAKSSMHETEKCLFNVNTHL